MKRSFSLAVSAWAMAITGTAYAAPTDYLLELDGVKGERKSSIAIESWSFGVCNSAACTAASQAAYDKCCRPQASQNTQSLRESPTRASTGKTAEAASASAGPGRASWDLAKGKGARTAAGGLNVAAGDVDGDGAPDLAFAASQDVVHALKFIFHTIPGEYEAVCASGKIDSATVSNGNETFIVSNVSVSCTKGAGSGAAAASYARSGLTRIDSTPARISTNMTIGKQTQGATFGEKVQSGLSSAGSAVASGAMTMTFTGGQMKHTKTGHVTLLK